jgi:hypothetical protein
MHACRAWFVAVRQAPDLEPVLELALPSNESLARFWETSSWVASVPGVGIAWCRTEVSRACHQLQTEAIAEQRVLQRAAEAAQLYPRVRRARLEVGRGRPVRPSLLTYSMPAMQHTLGSLLPHLYAPQR